MPCYSPLRAWRSRLVNETGKRSLVFDRRRADQPDDPIDLPCGQCIGCRLEKSRQWAVRCLHESTLHDDNCFITLTYDDDHLPDNGSLKMSHFQDFMKSLRHHVYPKKIRFFHCGEYGEKFNRPHYHALLFGHNFNDRVLHTTSPAGTSVYTSERLSRLWSYGFATCGDLTFDSCAYVARYILKKVTGPHQQYHYGDLKPEYVTMSRRPGIGKDWINSWADDVFRIDAVVIDGKEQKIPKFYDNVLSDLDSDRHQELLDARLIRAKQPTEKLSWERKRSAELIKIQQSKLLIRDYERN